MRSILVLTDAKSELGSFVISDELLKNFAKS